MNLSLPNKANSDRIDPYYEYIRNVFREFQTPYSERITRLSLKEVSAKYKIDKVIIYDMTSSGSKASWLSENELRDVLTREVKALRAFPGTSFVFSAESFLVSQDSSVLSGQREQRISHILKTSGYCLRNEYEILNFIVRNPILVGFLISSKAQIDSFFQKKELILEYVEDPEIVGWGKIWIKVVAKMDSDDCFEEVTTQLDAFDEDFWLDIPFKVKKLVSVDLEFNE